MAYTRKVHVKLPGQGNSYFHHQIISMIKWIRSSRSSIKNSLSKGRTDVPATTSRAENEVERVGGRGGYGVPLTKI